MNVNIGAMILKLFDGGVVPAKGNHLGERLIPGGEQVEVLAVHEDGEGLRWLYGAFRELHVTS